MVNKKYLLLAGICSLMAAQPVFAQESENSTKWSSRDMTYRGASYDALDSNYTPKSRMAQQRKFLNHQYAYPAKPRSMWEIGVSAGMYNVSGDVPALLLWQKGGYGFGLHVRKGWGYTFSTRLAYTYGIAKGLQWQGTNNFKRDPAWMSRGYVPVGALPGYQSAPVGLTPVFFNYRMEAHQLNFDLVASLKNISFHKARTNLGLYLFGGLGALAFNTRVNTTDASNARYDFEAIVGTTPQVYENRKTIRDALQGAMDNTYETVAENERGGRRPTIFGNKTFNFSPGFGLGLAYHINKRINIALEDRVSMPWDEDLLDGARWSNQLTGEPVTSNQNDGINYLSLGINFNLGNSKKRVEPLYWLNPLDHIYNELSYPRHMILPEPVLSDADGDGIADQFDKCPGTPAGVAVDSHGCPMDTDGDGVPDFRDKELITPTYCQPVDADGVGKCPCPDGCGGGAVSACSNINAGSIGFDANVSRIRPAAQAQLGTLASQMQANPTCKVVITGAGNASKVQQQRSWDRVNAVIEYMSEKHGIDRNRFIFQYGQAGDANTVMYRAAMTGEEGPVTIPPPFPNLRR
jgi:hypothetical protein